MPLIKRKVRVPAAPGVAPAQPVDLYAEEEVQQSAPATASAAAVPMHRVTEQDQTRIRIRLMDWVRWQFGGGVSSSAGMLGRVVSDTSGYRTASIPVNLDGDAERVNVVMLDMSQRIPQQRTILVWHYTGLLVVSEYVAKRVDMSQARFAQQHLHLNRRQGYHELLNKSERCFLDMLAGRYVINGKPLRRNDSLKMSNKGGGQSA